MSVQNVGRPPQGARVPPDIVVAQGNVRSAGAGDAKVAAGRSQIAARGHHMHRGKALPDRRDRVIARAIIHQNDLGLLRQSA